MSRNRRRAWGPSFTSARSSGEKITQVAWPMSSPRREAVLPLTYTTLRRRAFSYSRTPTSCRPSLRSTVSCTAAVSCPWRIISLSLLVRWLRPKQHRCTASSRLVLPAPFSPTSTVTPSGGASSTCPYPRKSRSLSAVIRIRSPSRFYPFSLPQPCRKVNGMFHVKHKPFILPGMFHVKHCYPAKKA